MSPAPAADLDRRFYAFALDRLVAWTAAAVGVGLAWYVLIARDRVAAGVAVAAGVVLLVHAALALVLGATGTSPGNAALGLRVVGAETGAPIGAGPALLRQLVLGASTVPTFGLGAATLAWTAAMDASGRRHGWHDRLTGSEVVDVRPAPEEPEVVEEAPRHVVNLTAMRLVPAAPSPPVGPPPAAPPPAGAEAPRPPQHRAPDPEQLLPRQRLGHPLVPEPAAPVARWRVTFDSGESFVVGGLVLVGRRPEARTGETPDELLALHSDDMSLSKTHAQLQVVADGVLVVMDRGSTNGTVLLRQGVARDLPAGQPTTLLDNDHVRFGDRMMSVSREP